ncbi:MAG: dihydroorotate dehydrogenase [Coriobacteriales bacterium]|jgi:dihydroorotate dehydrogenase (NAD+) catalytic subunit|nr:dihydroorotate dehydrogenase [Coriobacteriales bacterium]
MTNLTVNLGGMKMKNPITVASGTFGSGADFAALWEQTRAQGQTQPQAQMTSPSREALTNPRHEKPLSILGAVTTKGVSLEPWAGNPGTRIAETASGMLNSIGLQNPGVEAFCTHDLACLTTADVPVIVNVSGHTKDEYLRVIDRLEREPAVGAYEINISCPNVDSGGMAFGTDPAAAAAVTAACRTATKRPLIVKLSPNVTDITEIARAAEAAGADALSLINTVAGMAIDLQARKAVFARTVGGLSGPAIKPIALYAVQRVYQATRLPLLGMGGIASVEDALEFLIAGATAVAVGTANFTDPLTAIRLVEGLEQWCTDNGIQDINELIGALS